MCGGPGGGTGTAGGGMRVLSIRGRLSPAGSLSSISEPSDSSVYSSSSSSSSSSGID